jgi:hypothetical protein
MAGRGLRVESGKNMQNHPIRGGNEAKAEKRRASASHGYG